ncbi:hypothetical protein ACO2Q8_04090 [Larkinella sp. VNQ87]|uniref:hypothetical protein n=1 Tax=Larkinella sp. VNQ87 TaxID=3400921 RepID=UPI003C071FAB
MQTPDEIKPHLRNGDYSKIAQMVGVSRHYAIVLMGRPGAAKHKEVLFAARKVAKSNLKLGLVPKK